MPVQIDGGMPLDLCPDKGHPLAFLKRLSSLARGRHLSVGLEPRSSTFMPSSPLRQPVLQAFVSFPPPEQIMLPVL